ncbi:conserved exported hypothetical protein [Magnetospirillum sp. LM-5]|uniref:OmpA family protein n=1 Tax=Magnetospirillum sp. LM-5 TaxID=2681466 RepID=UPI00138424FD|nr:OmpA family protein [Magnetospirillum sp. LM-5]CAA7611635.1 conserved exported hypothetical protein [Magnetospirillum sp. LM-5]
MNRTRNAAAAALMTLLSACASGDRVVLLADPDGKVGKVEVSSAQGSQVLNQAGTGTVVQAGKAPSAPEAVPADTITKLWGDALRAMPDRPVTFQLYFKTGTAELTPEGLAELPKVRALAASRPHVVLLIAGHADAVGSDEVNIRISRERAESVRALLVKDGITARAVEVSSHGKRNPLVPTADGVAEPRNRRVTVTVQ